MGAGTELGQKFMEIRGLGIIDIQSMFGVRAIRFQKRLEIVVELESWDEQTEYTRTGLDDKFINIMDVEIPYIKLPIIPGKNITVISEVIKFKLSSKTLRNTMLWTENDWRRSLERIYRWYPPSLLF